MKFSSALVATVAPLALAKSVQKSSPARRDPHANAHALPQLIEPVEPVIEEEIIVIWANPGGGAPTQIFNPQATLSQTVAVPPDSANTVVPVAGGGTSVVSAGSTATIAGAAATHSVTVGGSAGLQYVPPSVEANVGDVILFTFQSQNHTATQSAFATPCEPLAGGMDSGFMPNLNDSVVPAPQVAMQVMVTTPLWFFCRQTGHCGKGMTFSVNPTAAKTQAMFAQMAIAQNGTGGSSAITGGTSSAAPAAPPAGSSLAPLAPLSSASGAALQPLATGTSPDAAGSTGLVTGSGTLDSTGACTCHVTCDLSGGGSFPAVQAQGIGSFGGMAGSIPVGQAETS